MSRTALPAVRCWNVLIHSGVGEVVAVVTRYYGGTKLGTGGLVRAYGGCVQQALASAPRAEKVALVRARVTIDHASVSALQRLLPTLEASVVAQEWDAQVALDVELPEGRVEELRRAVGDVTRGKGVVTTD